jgi:catechol 2,3-dioxygenase-like lactoylglutathione lyase family enzyme
MNTPTRDASAPTVHSLNCFVLSVPDLTVARRFYESFGLDVTQKHGRLELRTTATDHKWAEIVESGRGSKRFEYLSFGCYLHEFDKFAAYLKTRAFTTCNPHELATPEGIWLTHPDGYPIQIVVAEKTMPDHDVTPSIVPATGLRGAVAPGRSRVGRTMPRRLSHVLLFSSDVLGALAFFEAALGLRLSDRSGDGIAFMHGIHGSDHHMVAIAKSHGPGFHHASWDVASLDEVGNGMEQMAKAGYTQGWGVGRHVLGSNYFYYVRDPWGSYCEYSFDIDYVPKGHAWPARDHAPEDCFYMWGPPVPEEFVTNYERQGAP